MIIDRPAATTQAARMFLERASTMRPVVSSAIGVQPAGQREVTVGYPHYCSATI
jgi:hypothetical protein